MILLNLVGLLAQLIITITFVVKNIIFAVMSLKCVYYKAISLADELLQSQLPHIKDAIFNELILNIILFLSPNRLKIRDSK